MAAVSICPSGEELQRFARGTLEASSAERIIHHLHQCRTCLAALEGAPVEDTLIEALQTWGNAGDGVEKAAVEGLIQRLKKLAVGTPADPEATAADAPAAKTERFDFLSPPQAEGEIGRLGGYRILQLLGSGGMGMVFAAEDVRLKRKAALKVMKPDLAANEGAKKRFLREAESCAAVRSDHVITIYQVGEQGDAPFLAMEYLEGVSLDDWLKKGRKATLAQAARIGRQIALGLAAAHERGLIHRDIKPGNIWLESNYQGRVKLLDFGLARGTADEVHLTQSGAIVGTPAFMAPEQARGEKVDHRCDLFSLGVVLYRLTTGQMPFRGDNTMSILTALALDKPTPPRDINADIPPRMAALIERLLAKEREQRPATAKAVAEELANIEREATQPASNEQTLQAASAGERTRSAPSRSRLRWLVAASLLLVLGGLAAGIVIIVRDKDGNKVAEINLPKSGTVEIKDADKGEANRQRQLPGDKIAASSLSPLLPGTPLSPVALVQRPAKLPGVRSWSIESRNGTPGMTAVAYRPAGDRLAVGTDDGLIRIWEPRTGRLVQVLLGRHAVLSLAWSPDGRVLAAGSLRERVVRLWEAERGRFLRALEVPADSVHALSWSADGRSLQAYASQPWDCFTWNTADGKLLRRVALPPGIYPAFSPDGKRLAETQVIPDTVCIYDTQTGKEVRRLTGHKGMKAPVDWSPDGKRLACAAEGEVHVWDAETGKECFVHKPNEIGYCGNVLWSPDGQSLTWSHLYGVAVMEATAEAQPRSLEGPSSPYLTWLAWSPDSKTIARINERASVNLYDAATGKLRKSLSEGGGGPPASTWSLDGQTIAVSENGQTTLASVDTGQVHMVIEDTKPPLALSPDGRRVVTGGPDHTLVVWESGGKVRVTLTGHKQDPFWVAWSPDGKRLASASVGEKRVLLWDAEKGERLRELGPFAERAESVTWSLDGRLIAIKVANVGWHFWNVEQNKLTNDPKQWQVDSLAFAPHARTAVVLTSPSGVYQLREMATGKEQRGLPHSNPRPPVLSADGHLLAIPTDTGLELWRGDLSRRVRTLQAGVIIEKAFFSADGKLVAGREGGCLHLWETDTGRLRGKLLLGEANHGLTIAADGHYNGNDRVERGIVVVVQKDDGTQELLEPADFEQKYGWKNEPDKVHLLQPLPPWLTVPEGSPMGPQALVREPAALTDANSWTIETVNARGQVKALAYNPEGKLLATGGEDGTIRIWDTSKGKLVRMLVDDSMDSLSWSKDGKVLTAGNPKSGREWDVDTGRLLRRIAGVANPAVKEARSPDGKQSAKIEAMGVHLYDADGKRTHTLEEGNGKQQIVRLDDANGFPLGVRLPFDAYGQLAVTADGHYRGNARIERLIRMVVQKRDGSSETLTPREFEQKYGWKNVPDKVRLLDK